MKLINIVKASYCRSKLESSENVPKITLRVVPEAMGHSRKSFCFDNLLVNGNSCSDDSTSAIFSNEFLTNLGKNLGCNSDDDDEFISELNETVSSDFSFPAIDL